MSVRVAEGTVMISAELNESAVRRSATQAGQRAGNSFSRAFAGNSDIDTSRFRREGGQAGTHFTRGFQSRADFGRQGQNAAGDFGGSFGRQGQGEMGGAAGKFAKGFAVAAVFVAVGQKVAEMVTDGFKKALEQQDANALLQARIGEFGPEGKKLGKVAGELWSSGFADNIEDANAAIAGVKQNMRGLGVADLKGTAKGALTVAKIMDEDVGDVTKTVAQMMRTGLAKNANEAFDIITRGAQTGANKSQDLLDTFNEYGTQFRKVGLDGKTAMGLISQGLQGGARDADVVADSIKEFSIRAVDGSKTTAQGFQMLGLNADDMAAKFGKGGKVAKNALDLTLDRLRGIKDPVERSKAAVALFGTQAEDLGDALYSLDPSKAVDSMGKVGGAAKKAGDTIHGTLSSRIETFKRRMQQGLVNFITDKVLPAWDRFSAGVKDAWAKVKTATQPTVNFFKTEVWPTLIDGWGNLREKAKAISDFFQSTIWPAMQKGWEAFKEAVQPIVDAVKQMFDDLGGKGEGLKGIWENVTSTIKGYTDQVWSVIQELMDSIKEIWDKYGDQIMATVKIVWGYLGDIIGLALKNIWSIVKGAWQAIKGIVSGALQVIKGIIQVVTGLITGDWKKAWTGIKNIFGGIWKAIKGVLQGAWTAISGVLKNAYQFVMDKTSGLRKWVVDKFVSLKNGVVGAFRSARDTLWSVATWIRDKVTGAFRTLRDNAVKAFTAARDRIKSVWDGLKNIAKKPVEFIINTVYNNGIRKVWNAVVGAFGGHKLGAVKGFARGGVLPGMSSWRNGDDQLVPMRKGEGVYVSEAMKDPYERARLFAVNKAAMQGKSLSQFQGGGFAFGGIFDGIGSALGSAWDKVKKGASWLKDTFGGAIKSGVKKVVNPLINAIPGSSGFSKLLKGGAHRMVDRLLGAGKEGDKRSTPHVNYSPSAGVEQWRPVVLTALRQVNQSAALANTTLRRMQQESGGNPTIVNRWDSNWKAGHPSVGLMQVIGPTFRSYAGRYKNKGPFSYGVSVDPLANVYSSMRYAMGAYGSLSRAYNRPGGYDSGGWLEPGWKTTFNGTGKPEAVLTNAQWTMIAELVKGSTTPAGSGKSVTIENLTIEVDASKLKSIQDVVDMISGLKVTARQFGARVNPGVSMKHGRG